MTDKNDHCDDDERLEQLYNEGLELQKQGKVEAAIKAFKQCLELDPQDSGGASIRLAVLGGADVPDAAPAAYIATLFDQHAQEFEEILVDQLGYDVPDQMRTRFQELSKFGPFDRMLDLGCGTGLAGEAFEECCDILVAVDISQTMVEIAAERGCYDDLYIAEIAQFLSETDEGDFDLIVAADVIIYMGNLDRFFDGVKRVASHKCTLTFSTELQSDEFMDGRDWAVGPHHRYAHSAQYIHQKLDEAGFAIVEAEEITVRYEEGEPVKGLLVIAQRGED